MNEGGRPLNKVIALVAMLMLICLAIESVADEMSGPLTAAIIRIVIVVAIAVGIFAVLSRLKGKQRKQAPKVPNKAVDEQPVDRHDVWAYGGQRHIVCNPELCQDETESRTKAWLLIIVLSIAAVVFYYLACR